MRLLRQLVNTGMLPTEVIQSEHQALTAELHTIASIIDTVSAIAPRSAATGSTLGRRKQSIADLGRRP